MENTVTIITIGDELLIGQVIDTNSSKIASMLSDAGFRILRKSTVGDDAGDIKQALADALAKSALVVTTGGLGPTRDDITKSVMAELFNCTLQMHQPTLDAVTRRLTARGIDVNALNRDQALLPSACQVLPNDHGTAPGMVFRKERSMLIALPGVPFEMEQLMHSGVLPLIAREFETGQVYHRTLMTYGIPESMLAEKIAGWEDSLPVHFRLAYLPNPSGIRLRLSSYGVPAAQAQAQSEVLFGELHRIIPDNILGFGDCVSLQSAVASILTERNLTLAVAESCTGGYLSSLFTGIAGSSKYFLAGITAYGNRAKTELLGVPADEIDRNGAVSRQVAESMARGMRTRAHSDYALATTGIAGPDGGTHEKPVGTVWIALAHPDGVVSRKFTFGALRKQNIERASAAATDMLRLLLTGNSCG